MIPLLLQHQADREDSQESAEDRRLRNDMERALLATGDRRLRHVCVSVQEHRVTRRCTLADHLIGLQLLHRAVATSVAFTAAEFETCAVG